MDLWSWSSSFPSIYEYDRNSCEKMKSYSWRITIHDNSKIISWRVSNFEILLASLSQIFASILSILFIGKISIQDLVNNVYFFMKKYLIILGYLIIAILIAIVLSFLAFAVPWFSSIFHILNFWFITGNLWQWKWEEGIWMIIALSLFINFIYSSILMVVVHKFIKNRSRKT